MTNLETTTIMSKEEVNLVTPLGIVEDFGIKTTKLGLAYDKTIFRVDSAGYLTDIN